MLTYADVCRFFAGEVFALDILAKYDYLLRLDSDSYLIGKLTLADVEGSGYVSIRQTLADEASGYVSI